MRELNWMTVIFLVVMAIAFISAIFWIVSALVRRNRNTDVDSNHDN